MKPCLAHLGWELRKVLSGRTALAGIAAVTAFELAFMLLLQVPSVRPALTSYAERFGYHWLDVRSALTTAYLLVGRAVGAVGAVFVALISAQSIAQEVESGTLRLMLCRPVSRLRIWSVKLCVCFVYTFVIVTASAAGSLGFAALFDEWAPMAIRLSAQTRVVYSATDGLLLYTWSTFFQSLSVCTVAVIAFALSSCGMRGATSAVVTLAYLFGEDQIRQMPFFASVRKWFVMESVTSWNKVFHPSDDWRWVWDVYVPLGIFSAVVLTVSLAVFLRRDFKP